MHNRSNKECNELCEQFTREILNENITVHDSNEIVKRNGKPSIDPILPKHLIGIGAFDYVLVIDAVDQSSVCRDSGIKIIF